jgi:hypothetical protein
MADPAEDRPPEPLREVERPPDRIGDAIKSLTEESVMLLEDPFSSINIPTARKLLEITNTLRRIRAKRVEDFGSDGLKQKDQRKGNYQRGGGDALREIEEEADDGGNIQIAHGNVGGAIYTGAYGASADMQRETQLSQIASVEAATREKEARTRVLLLEELTSLQKINLDDLEAEQKEPITNRIAEILKDIGRTD